MSEQENKRKRLWVVSELYYPEDTSTGYYLTRIAEGLAGDLDVKVLCGQPTYSKRGMRFSKRELHKNVEIFRVFGTTFDKNVIPLRVVNMLTLGASVFFAALRRFRRGDKVLVVTTPPTMPFVVAIASLIKGAGYTLLIHDSYPEILVAARKTRPESLFFKTASVANRWLYKHCAKIIVVGRDMEEMTRHKTHGLDIPIVYIPNWAELETVSPAPREENTLIKELGIQEKVIFLYAGNMGYPNDMESLIECAKRLQDEGQQKPHFVFLGSGVKRKWLEREVAANGLENVTILDPRPRSEQQEFLNACDIAIVSLVSNMKGVSMPSRTYNILAAGKPILAITEPGSEIDLVVKENAVGWSVFPQKPEELYVTIQQIVSEHDKYAEMGLRARQAAESEYSLDTAIERYRSAI
ncbi:glycosyltransferase family 4 protein [Leptolyngbya sp. 7M]|uniref:glycosyltransferase family 4 protein n=1 Tax=Leptolyngbya sp. 7M TaxID=2812896 RepID=UPI001B8B439B|nr:glycosyltransferase family 4 protein [Leptolyngbya sp. 7M]QYO67346.1 glycosyltransferase family 4 protein [Leptolyngbya sp. 7M]